MVFVYVYIDYNREKLQSVWTVCICWRHVLYGCVVTYSRFLFQRRSPSSASRSCSASCSATAVTAWSCSCSASGWSSKSGRSSPTRAIMRYVRARHGHVLDATSRRSSVDRRMVDVVCFILHGGLIVTCSFRLITGTVYDQLRHRGAPLSVYLQFSCIHA